MLALVLLAASATVTAEDAIRIGRARMRAAPADCGRGSGDIVVCGRRDDGARHRLPLPEERGPAEGRRMATGERPAGDATPLRQVPCGVIDRGQVCRGSPSTVSAAGAIARLVQTLVDPDGIAEPDDFTRRPGGRRPQPATPLSPR